MMIKKINIKILFSSFGKRFVKGWHQLIRLFTGKSTPTETVTLIIEGIADGVHDYYRTEFDEDISRYDAVMQASKDLQEFFDKLVKDKDEKEQLTQPDTVDNTEQPAPSKPDQPVQDTSVDGVDFKLLNWKYGGENGSNAKLSTVRIKDLRCSKGSLYYSWNPGLSEWGIAHTDAAAICALFCQKADGSWVGGKFDWVSTSRTNRSLKHCIQGYKGWRVDDLPNPCKVVFVVTTPNMKLRSNVAGPVEWAR